MKTALITLLVFISGLVVTFGIAVFSGLLLGTIAPCGARESEIWNWVLVGCLVFNILTVVLTPYILLSWNKR